MAGDWIPMRVDLRDDPAVISISAVLDLDIDSVIGKLHRAWSWANQQLSRDGHAVGVTSNWLNAYVGCDGFAEAMDAVGWLRFESGDIVFVDMDNWISESGKDRLKAARRQKRHRERKEIEQKSVTKASRSKRDKNVTTVQDSTVNTPLPPEGGAERSANEGIRKAVAACWFTAGVGPKQARRLESFVAEFAALRAEPESIGLRHKRAVAEYGAAKATARCVLNNWSTLGLCLVRTETRPQGPPLADWQMDNPTFLAWCDRHAAKPALAALDPCGRYYAWMIAERKTLATWTGRVLEETRGHYASCAARYGSNEDEWSVELVTALASLSDDGKPKQAVLC